MTHEELIALVKDLSISLHAANLRNDGSCSSAAIQTNGQSNDYDAAATTATATTVATAARTTVAGSILGRATEFEANDAMTSNDYENVYPNIWTADPAALANLAPLSPLSLPNAGKAEQVRRDESIRHAVLEAEKAEEAHEEKRTG